MMITSEPVDHSENSLRLAPVSNGELDRVPMAKFGKTRGYQCL